MGTGSVKIEFNAEDADLLRSFKKQNQEILKNFNALTQLAEAGEKAGNKTKNSVDAASRSLRQFLGAVTGIGSVVGGIAAVAAQLRREFENIVQRQKTAADRQVDFADSLSQAIRNAGGLLTGTEVEQATLRISEETSVTPNKVAQSLGAALSARGATTKEQANEAVRATQAALTFAPELDAEGAASLAGVAIDVSKRFGVSPEKAIGFVQNVGSLARVTDLPNLVQNVAPAVNNLTQFGFTPQEAGSLVTTLTQGTGDFSGNLSATAAINFSDSLRERFPGQDPVDVIDQLRADPKLRKAFLEGGRIGGKKFGAASLGRGKAKPTIEALLTEGTLFARQFDEGIGKIGTFDQGLETFRSTIDEINSVGAVTNARLRRIFETGAQQLSIVDTSGGKASITRAGLEEVLRASGATDAQVRSTLAVFELDGGISERLPVEHAQELFRNRIESLRNPRPIDPFATNELGESRVRLDPSQKDLEFAGTLERINKALDKLADDSRPQNVKVINDKNRGRSRSRRPLALEKNDRRN